MLVGAIADKVKEAGDNKIGYDTGAEAEAEAEAEALIRVALQAPRVLRSVMTG